MLESTQKALAEMETKLREATEKLNAEAEGTKLVESKLRIANDRYARKETLSDLLAPLGKEKKEIMSDLLESVKTENLEKQFNKYLPSVLDGETMRVKKTITESVRTEQTGNKKASAKVEANDSTDVVEIQTIRKLAGLSK